MSSVLSGTSELKTVLTRVRFSWTGGNEPPVSSCAFQKLPGSKLTCRIYIMAQVPTNYSNLEGGLLFF